MINERTGLPQESWAISVFGFAAGCEIPSSKSSDQGAKVFMFRVKRLAGLQDTEHDVNGRYPKQNSYDLEIQGGGFAPPESALTRLGYARGVAFGPISFKD